MSNKSYTEAGVNIDAGEQVTKRIKDLARSTHSSQVLHGIGLFSSFYQLDLNKYTEPVLVSSIDGVGTKVKLAEMMGLYHTIGQDLVNHCVNDIAVCGADPLFFADYIATDRLQPDLVHDIIKGIALACKTSEIALVGGETAEMPGVYQKSSFDLAGAITGVVNKKEIIDGQKIAKGDILVGLQSNGVHTNGYSLVRKIFFEDNNYSPDRYMAETDSLLGQELLRVHKCYLSIIRDLRAQPYIHGISHITGGGIVGNTKRLTPETMSLKIDWKAWQWPPIFDIIAQLGNIAEEEMREVFNLGIGIIIVVDQKHVDQVQQVCQTHDVSSWVIGSVK